MAFLMIRGAWHIRPCSRWRDERSGWVLPIPAGGVGGWPACSCLQRAWGENRRAGEDSRPMLQNGRIDGVDSESSSFPCTEKLRLARMLPDQPGRAFSFLNMDLI